MDSRFHKRALSAAAAVLTLTSAVTTVSAAQKNEITLSANNTVIKSSDSFNLTVSYKPDSVGASGFTIDLHYDPEAVTLNIPDENSYNISSSFALVTNFEYDNGTVRIVGAEMEANNVRSETNIAYLSFTVNDGYEGDIAFWTDVDTLVYSSGDSFVNADYNAPGKYSQYVLTAAPKEQQTEPPTTKPAPKPAPPTETTEETTTTTTTVTTPSLPEEIVPETTVSPELPDTDNGDDNPAVPGETDNGYDTPDDFDTPHETSSLFYHSQGGSDYVNDEALQYSFSPFDFCSENIADKTVDISIEVYSTDTVVGGIGMLTYDGWTVYDGQESNGSAIWVANDVDLSEVSGDISVQIYYMKHDSTFEINNIIVTTYSNGVEEQYPYIPDDTEQSDGWYPSEDEVQPEDTVTETTETEPEQPAEDADNESNPSEKEDSDTDSSQSGEDTADSEDEEDSSSLPGSSGVLSETTDDEGSESDSNSSDADSLPSDNDSSSKTDSSSVAVSGTSTTTNTSPSDSDVVAAVSSAKEIADSNPDTGKKIATEFYIAGGLIAASLAQIGYSIYSLGKRNNKNK